MTLQLLFVDCTFCTVPASFWRASYLQIRDFKALLEIGGGYSL